MQTFFPTQQHRKATSQILVIILICNAVFFFSFILIHCWSSGRGLKQCHSCTQGMGPVFPCLYTEPSSARTCMWGMTWAPPTQPAQLRGPLRLQQRDRQDRFQSCFILGHYLPSKFDKATGKCILPMDGFFVSLRSEIVISSQTESHTQKNSHQKTLRKFMLSQRS